MPKAVAAVLFLAALWFSMPTVAQLPDFATIEVETQKVVGSVYMLTGAGGNIAVSAGPEGLVMVDCEYPQMAQKIDAALKKISDKPVRYLINTHWHADHASGDPYFEDHGAVVIARANLRTILASGTMRDGVKYDPAPKDALPNLTYSDRATLYLNGEEVRLIHFANAHTDGDTVVYFATSDVLHMGDNYRTDGFPLVDQDNGGTVKSMIAALDSVLGSFPPNTKVIPGHGSSPMTVADIKPFVEMLRDCRARVEKGIRDGKSLDQLTQGKVLAGYESYSHRISSDRFTEMLYRELTENKPPKAS